MQHGKPADVTGGSVAARIWAWLPGRTDRRRHTDPATIAVNLAVPQPQIRDTLAAMEREGHAIRDRSRGRRADQWHRGIPYPRPPAAVTAPEVTTEPLW